MKLIRSKLIVAIGIVALFTSCQQALKMWVVPGSTRENLVFGWSTTRNGEEKIQPESIRVFPCDTIRLQPNGGFYPKDENAVWAAWFPNDKLPALTNRINYGQGFLQDPSKPLTAPGCYVVIAYALESHGITEVASMGFKIASDGLVTDMPSNEYEALFH